MKKNNIKKKCLPLLMAATIGCTSLTSLAANTGDTNFPIKAIGFQYSAAAQTQLRDKQDKTSHYVYNMSGFNLWIRSLASNNVNCTYKEYAIVQPGEWFIWNTVRENGYTQCKLDITTAQAGSTGILSGKWSPDSVGSYPVANR